MGFWKGKVIPKFKKLLDGPKKAAAASESCKNFDANKEEITKLCEEKKEELHPKVVEIYESSSVELKTFVMKPTKKTVKKHSELVTKFLELLSKIDFPGAKQALDDSTEHGLALVSTSVFFVFQKVVAFLPEEPKESKPEEAAVAEVAVEEKSKEVPAHEIVEEAKKEVAAAEGPSPSEPDTTATGAKEEAAVVEPPKV